MSLRRIFEEMYAIVEGATRHLPWAETSRTLGQGARVTVRASGPRRQVILARQGAPVGLVETDTFIAHGRIPDDAAGVCYPPTPAGLYRVSFTWEIATPLPTLFDLAPAADGDLPQLAPAEAKVPAPAASHVTQLLAEGEALPGDL